MTRLYYGQLVADVDRTIITRWCIFAQVLPQIPSGQSHPVDSACQVVREEQPGMHESIRV